MTASMGGDIWAFGVLIWEIASLGAAPYAVDAVSGSIAQHVLGGSRLSRPDGCPDMLWELVQFCWLDDASARLPFKALHRKLTADAAAERSSNLGVDPVYEAREAYNEHYSATSSERGGAGEYEYAVAAAVEPGEADVYEAGGAQAVAEMLDAAMKASSDGKYVRLIAPHNVYQDRSDTIAETETDRTSSASIVRYNTRC